MASKTPSLRSGLRRAAFGTAATLLHADPSGQAERKFHKVLIGRLKGKPDKIQSLAWHAEERNDLVLALQAWLALAPEKARKSIPATKIYAKLAALETRIRRQVGFYAPKGAMVFPEVPEVVLTADKFADQPVPSARTLRMERAALEAFWATVDTMSDRAQGRLRKAYAGLAAHRNRAGRQHIARSALQPVLARWKDYQTAYPLLYKAALQSLEDELGDPKGSPEAGWRIVEDWWHFFETRQELLTPATQGQIWQLSLRFASALQKKGLWTEAERVVMPAFEFREDNAAALTVLARASEARQDWRQAAERWQLYAAIMNPVSTKSGTIVAENAEERARKANFARKALRVARAELALECHVAGRKREFRELAARIIESLPDQRVLKYDPLLLDVARLYVQDALYEDQVFALPQPETPGKLRNVALCLDILKVSDVHTHSRVIFTMCRNMLRHDPDLHMHIVITNERFAVSTPVVSPSFNPTRDTEIEDRARAALGDLYGSRFHLHLHHETGLEGVVNSCKQILDLKPDLILWGGGHRGLFSNESRLVRHALFDLVPAAFFYIQANNEVDPKFDMIIARGPHAVEGDPGEAAVRIQPYPTIVEEALAAAQTEVNPAKAESKAIISAITGVRMDVRLSELSKAEMNGFFSILDRVPGAVWHFIGCRDVAAVKKANKELARRVKAGQIKLHTVMPFEEFTDLVGNAALFLHLPGFTGGSGGAAVARRGAIPILTFNHSDVSGRQPPETVFEVDNIKGFADMAVELLQDPARWTEIAQRQIAHTDWIRTTSVQGFHDCLVEAAQLGQKRLTSAMAAPEVPADQKTQDGAT